MDTETAHEPVKTPVKRKGNKLSFSQDIEDSICRRYYVDGETAPSLASIFGHLTKDGSLAESTIRLIARRAWPRVRPTLSPEQVAKVEGTAEGDAA